MFDEQKNSFVRKQCYNYIIDVIDRLKLTRSMSLALDEKIKTLFRRPSDLVFNVHLYRYRKIFFFFFSF